MKGLTIIILQLGLLQMEDGKKETNELVDHS